MAKKNYLTNEEQEVWGYIHDKEIIDNELIRQIFPEIKGNKRNKILHNLFKKGYIKRARKDLYYNPKNLTIFYKLALKFKEGYIGLSSAIRYYNLLDYEDFTIFVITKNFQKKIDLKDTKYSIQFIPLSNLFTGFEKKNEFYISTIEKTLFDCLLKPNSIGFTNITKAFYDAKVDWNKLIRFFTLTNNNSLCQRTGYILELMKVKTKLKVPEFVFKYLLKKVKYPVKLIPIDSPSHFNTKWKIEDNLGENKILSWWH